jgi:hypothetical protein
VQSGSSPAFRRKILPLSSGYKSNPNKEPERSGLKAKLLAGYLRGLFFDLQDVEL